MNGLPPEDPDAYATGLATLVAQQNREQFELDLHHLHQYANLARATGLTVKAAYWQHRIERLCRNRSDTARATQDSAWWAETLAAQP